MAGNWVTWYSNAVRALRELRGDSGTGANGAIMPALRPLDTIAILGQIAPRLVTAIEDFMASQNTGEYAKRAISAGFVDSDKVMPRSFWDRITGGETPASVSIAEYLAGAPSPRSQSIRICPNDEFTRQWSQTGLYLYTIWISETLIIPEEKDRIRLYADSVGKWQDAVDASAATLRVSDFLGIKPADPSRVDYFLTAIRKLCNQMDSLQAYPPITDGELVRRSLDEAASGTSRWLGERAADVAAKAGEIAAQAAGGFLNNASMMSLAVAGLAVFVALR